MLISDLSANQMKILRQALGADSNWPGYRNRYCALDGHFDCESLVDLGLMARGLALANSSSRFYHVTEQGQDLIGVKETD